MDTSLEVTLYPKETHRDGDSTAARVMVNADALPPTVYVTHMQEAYSDPSKHSEYLPAGPAAGKRTAAKLAAMMRQASAEPEAEEKKVGEKSQFGIASPRPVCTGVGARDRADRALRAHFCALRAWTRVTARACILSACHAPDTPCGAPFADGFHHHIPRSVCPKAHDGPAG